MSMITRLVRGLSLACMVILGFNAWAEEDENGIIPSMWYTFDENASPACNHGSFESSDNKDISSGEIVLVADSDYAWKSGTAVIDLGGPSSGNIFPTTYVAKINLNGQTYQNAVVWGTNGQRYTGPALVVNGNSTDGYTVTLNCHSNGSVGNARLTYSVPNEKVEGYHQYAVTIASASDTILYVDGEEVARSSEGWTTSQNGMTRLGQGGNGYTKVAEGLIYSDFRFYTQSLTFKQIQTINGIETGKVTMNGKWYETIAAALAKVTQEGEFVISLQESITENVNIPANVTIETSNACKLTGTVTGSGMLVCAGHTPSATGFTNASSWSGTLWIKNTSGFRIDAKAAWGNAASKVRFTNCTGTYGFNNQSDQRGPVIELQDEDSSVALEISSNSNLQFKFSEIAGTGTLKVSGSGTRRYAFEKADNFAGSINLASATCTVILGSADDVADQAGNIVIPTGAVASFANGKSWSVTEGKSIVGTGTIKPLSYPVTLPASITADDSAWTGTVELVGLTFDQDTTINFNTLGNNGSKVKVNGITENINFVDNFTVKPEVVLAGNVTFAGGWGNKVINFSKLTVLPEASASFVQTNNVKMENRINITDLDVDGTLVIGYRFIVTITSANIAGRCEVNNGTLSVTTGVNLSSEEASLKVTAAVADAETKITTDVEGKQVKFDETSKTYSVVDAPTEITITIPTVANTTFEVWNDSVDPSVKIDVDGNGAITVAPGTEITIIYTPVAGYAGGGEVSVTIESAQTEISTTEVVVTEAVARIDFKIGEDSYYAYAGVLADAFTEYGGTVTLLKDVVVEETFVMPAFRGILNFNGHTISGELSGTSVIKVQNGTTVYFYDLSESATKGGVVNNAQGGYSVENVGQLKLFSVDLVGDVNTTSTSATAFGFTLIEASFNPTSIVSFKLDVPGTYAKAQVGVAKMSESFNVRVDSATLIKKIGDLNYLRVVANTETTDKQYDVVLINSVVQIAPVTFTATNATVTDKVNVIDTLPGVAPFAYVGQSLPVSFAVTPDEGYAVTSVAANGVELTATEEGKYVVEATGATLEIVVATSAVSTGPTSWETITDADVATIVTDLPSGSRITATEIAAWAMKNNVTFEQGIKIPVEALILNCAPEAIPADLPAEANAALKQIATDLDLVALMKEATENGSVTIPTVEGTNPYPYAVFKLVPSTKLESTDSAKFFRLTIELK